MSFYTSLSGLKAAQTDLGVVSNNIANVGSFGFKKSRALFGDIMAASRTTAGQGTRLKSIQQQFSQGGFETSANELDLAISGNGFFVTRDALTGGSTKFTRNGAFKVDEDRYLRDSNGGYVQILPVDTGGNVTSTGLDSARNLQFPLLSGTPVATSQMEFSIGLPASADVVADRPAYSGGYTFDRLDPNSYNHSTQTTVYDSNGDAIPATLYFVRTESVASGDAEDAWDVHFFVGDQQASATPGATPPTPLRLEFGTNGAITSPTAATTFGSVQPAGASAPLAISLDFGAATNQSTGTFTVAATDQNGLAAGKLDDVSIGEDGLVTATFSNGETQKIGKLVMANFANPAGLKQRGDGQWSVTGNSGQAQVGTAGDDGFGRVQSGALERANVDITEELVALISAQRNFQANAKAIETANQITQTIVNLRT